MKEIEITYKVTNCKECHFSTNSSIDHSDPFTSAPINKRWWCEKDGHNISNEKIIDKNCPFLQFNN